MLNQEHIVFANGVKMPKLIYGTAWKKEETTALVIKAIQLGFQGIDTACQPKHYNEFAIGQALKKLKIPREEFFLQSKFTPISGQDPAKTPYDSKAPIEKQVAQSFLSSQKNLNTNFVDSLLLHSPLPTWTDTMIAWKAMEKIASEGGAKLLGISNCYELSYLKAFYEEAKVKPSILQNRFYRETNYDKKLRQWCTEKNIAYQSFWTLTANPEILQSVALREIAHAYNKTEAQVFFRFLTQKGVVPLTGTSSEKHMEEDLNIFEFKLSFQHLEEIEAMLD